MHKLMMLKCCSNRLTMSCLNPWSVLDFKLKVRNLTFQIKNKFRMNCNLRNEFHQPITSFGGTNHDPIPGVIHEHAHKNIAQIGDVFIMKSANKTPRRRKNKT